jgi:hypothetical protein
MTYNVFGGCISNIQETRSKIITTDNKNNNNNNNTNGKIKLD